MRQSRMIYLAALCFALGGAFFALNLKLVFAQSNHWQMFCPDRIQVTQQNGGYLVTCYDPDGNPAPTATQAGPTATATRTPTRTPTQPAGPTATRTPTRTPTQPAPPPGGSILVDHNSIALFEQIPSQYLTAARNLKVLFSDRSVGVNFNEALNCLAAGSFGAAPAYCRRELNANGNVVTYSQADYDAGRVPAVIRFAPNPTNYNRSNWVFELREGHWSTLTCDFVQSMGPAHLDKNILSYQFSYLNVDPGSDIMQFWNNNPNLCDIYDVEAFMAWHPDKTILFWTTSLSRGSGSQEATDFNNRMRQYARDNRRVLFDFAAIEAYKPNGQPCYDHRDGVAYTSPVNGNVENYPNDGLNLPAICQDYTTETDGGHLGSVSGARIRTAKAFWVLMAQIAGWRP